MIGSMDERVDRIVFETEFYKAVVVSAKVRESDFSVQYIEVKRWS